MAERRDGGGFDLAPLLILAALLGLMLAGWWAFPAIARLISTQDCVALGRTSCG